MCSTPPAMATSYAPTAIPEATVVTAVIAPAHIRSIAKPGTVRGKPARMAAVRPIVSPWSPVWVAAATATSSTRSGGSSGCLRRSSRMTFTTRSSARVWAYMPFSLALPKGVRTPSTNTTSDRPLPDCRAADAFSAGRDAANDATRAPSCPCWICRSRLLSRARAQPRPAPCYRASYRRVTYASARLVAANRGKQYRRDELDLPRPRAALRERGRDRVETGVGGRRP